MPVCARCQKDTGILGAITFNRKAGRCGKCDAEVQKSLASFRQGFLAYTQDGVLADQEWQWLQSGAATERIDFMEALTFIRGDALHFLDRVLSFAAADGIILEEEEQAIHRLQQRLAIPPDIARPILDRLGYLRYLTRIRQGHLPTLQPSVRLDSDELCHLESGAVYHKVNAKSITQIQGRLLATNKKLHFLAQTGGSEIPWKSVMQVIFQPGGVYLELSRKGGNGFYAVQDPAMTQATLDTTLRINRREVLVPNAEAVSRHIPQDVRIGVWQRDQGRCIQCGVSGPGAWLEFDHIIPHSLGGANTIANVQLLCRGCNLKKSNRI